jgi:redox-sensitive bicupin YhaK (pirin superfamily)
VKEEGNGLYCFVLEGSAEVAGEQLQRRDALGLWETQEVDFEIKEDSRLLLMEVPMTHG